METVSEKSEADGALRRYEQLYINGEWVDPIDGGLVESIDPATAKPWAICAFGGPKDIDRAVAAARQALDGPWGRMPAWQRAAAIRRFADLFGAFANEMALLETRDSGRSIRESRPDIANHAQWYHWFASLADKQQGDTIPIDPAVHAFTEKVPVGVVGCIMAWNVPLLSVCWKMGPALAAGCTVVLKPAEQTPVTTLELARIVHEAGLPPGVVNIVPGYGHDAGARLVAHPDVAKISFTGEGRTAREIVRNGADNLKRFTFELGGKSPHILFADADIEQALNAATASAWAVCGQSCALGSRVLVERSIYDKVVDTFRERAKAVRVGLPLDEATHMGPQAHEAQLNKTLSYVALGKEEGAELVAGGARIESPALAGGYFVQPTVFANVTNTMRIAREEIFGPVAAIIPFDDEDEAIAIANDTTYGLTAGLWTQNNGRAHRVSRQIRAGMVWVNCYRFIRWSTPYGGMKASGWGRENGIDALEPYLDTRTTVIGLTGQYPNPYVA